MTKTEVVIDEEQCQGCGYCVRFCPRQCIMISGHKFNKQGYLLPSVDKLEECSACGICAWMCPAAAIEVYKLSSKARA